MFQTRTSIYGYTKSIEVAFTASSLNSNDAYVCFNGKHHFLKIFSILKIPENFSKKIFGKIFRNFEKYFEVFKKMNVLKKNFKKIKGEKIWVWQGVGATEGELGGAIAAISKITDQEDSSYTVVKEGEESDEFW